MVLIVGGAGYIGSHANKELAARGYETLVLDNLVYGHQEMVKWGRFVPGDIGDSKLLDSVFRNYPIDAVMHFSAFAYVGESVINPEKYYINNVSNTLNLLQMMRKHHVDKFIFSSTCASYGNPLRIPIDEEHPQYPINPYGKSKLMLETILKDYSSAYNTRFIALRYFNAAGADPNAEIGEWHDPETHLIPLVLDAALGKRQAVTVFGRDYETEDGTCVRDYIHVNDIARAHVLALEYLMAGGNSQFINLSNGQGFSVSNVIQAAEKVTGKTIPVNYADQRPGDPDILVGSAEKAERILHWKPQLSGIYEILETAWNWHNVLYDQYKN